MQQLQLSSGDLVADRRASYAQMLRESGDHGAAADLMRDAVALAPEWIAGRFKLGEMLEEAGRIAEAVDAWREVLRLDPSDRLGATLKLHLAGQIEGLDAPPSAFVEALFDQYADRFDRSLVEKLNYCVPELLSFAIDRLGRDGFAHLADLGCGTGLLGQCLRNRVSFAEGVDISAGMLRKAEAKQVYDRLVHADLSGFEIPAGTDIVTAADVFMYVGAMRPVAERVAAALPVGGVFAFSVELHEGPEEMVLRPSRRYAHARAPLLALLMELGFELRSCERETIRTDGGLPITGLIVVAEKAAPSTLPLASEAETVAGQPLLH